MDQNIGSTGIEEIGLIAQMSNNFEICTELDTISVVLCTHFQNELTAKMDDLNGCYFAILEFEMC